MKGICTLFLLSLFLCPCLINAQQVTPFIINVTGGSATSNYYRFDWSVGEMCLVNTFSQPNAILENGFLHPGTEHSKDTINFFAKGDVMVFPNPAYATTEIDIVLPVSGAFRMTIFDILGRQVLNKEFIYNGAGRVEKLNIDQFRAGTYFLHVVLTPTDAGLPERKGTYKITHLTR